MNAATNQPPVLPNRLGHLSWAVQDVKIHTRSIWLKNTWRRYLAIPIIGVTLLWALTSDPTLSESVIFSEYGDGYDNWEEFTSDPNFKLRKTSCPTFLTCKTSLYFANRSDEFVRYDKVIFVEIRHWRWGSIISVRYA